MRVQREEGAALYVHRGHETPVDFGAQNCGPLGWCTDPWVCEVVIARFQYNDLDMIILS